MTPSKEEKLIKLTTCLEELHMRELQRVINFLKNTQVSKITDINAFLTKTLYTQVFEKYLGEIIANPNHQPLRQFCLEDIGPIKLESALQSSPKFNR